MIDLIRKAKKATRASLRRLKREEYHRDLERPLRYLGRTTEGHVYPFMRGDGSTGWVAARAMGTHETVEHARRRVGW